MQRPAEKRDAAADGLAAGKAGDRLVHHRLKDGRREIGARRALVDKRLDVRLGEHAAARGDGVDLLIVRGLAVETRGIGLQQGGHLVDKRAGAAGADAVHALFEPTFEVDDLGILAAEFDGDIHLRRDALERLRDGDDLLHKGDAERLGKVDRAGAGGAQFERALAERCARLLE